MTANQFDHLDPGLAPVMNEVFAAFRSNCPVAHSDRHGGFWSAFSHGAVRSTALDTRGFSSAAGIAIPPVTQDVVMAPMQYDPPEHAAFRAIIQKHFTRAAVAKHEAALRELVGRRLSALAAEGGADLVSEFAAVIPPIAFAEVMGLPHEDAQLFVSWTNELFAAAVMGDLAGQQRTFGIIASYLQTEIDRQRRAGADTVTTAIADGRLDGDGRALTQGEQLGMILLLVLAGHETTVAGIATMLYCLATVDGLREKVVERPDLIGKMVDESLRFESPVIGIARTVGQDAELAGQSLHAGERVLMVLSSANRDPEVFDRPDEFVCPRDRNPHLTFGTGVHRCVGEHLSLLEMRVVAEEVLRLVPDFTLVEGHRPRWVPGRLVRSLDSLPVTFER
ncbi:cytochrome P450 [Solihabitans fulvus]|nr:cytochrome P450 [Solihabitans fulvus]